VNAAGTGAAAKKAADITVRTTGWAYALPDTKATPLETKLADITEPAPKAAEQAAKPAAAGAAPSAKPPGK
jgi:hypothetical protein